LSTVAKTGQILTQLATQVQSAPTAFSSKMARSCCSSKLLEVFVARRKDHKLSKG